MEKYITKFFGEFYADKEEDEIIIDGKIEIDGKTKDVSVLLINCYKYSDRLNECVKYLNEYNKINETGKNEIIKNYHNKGIIKNYIEKCFERYEEEIIEKSFGTKDIKKIDINKIVKKMDPANIVFDYNNEEIIISINYSIVEESDEIIDMEMDKEYKITREIKIFE